MESASEALDGAEVSGPRTRAVGLAAGTGLFLFFLWAPGLGLEPIQRRVAATAALTATLWLTVAIPVGAASLLPAALFPILGVIPAKEVAPIYLRDLVLLFLGAFVVALGLERWGVHKRIALGVVHAMGSSRRRLVLGFMCASAFLSMWINNTATTLLMLPIVGAVLSRADEEDGAKEDGSGADPRFAWCLLLGVAYSASVGGMGTPVGTAPNQEFLGQFSARFPGGPKLTFGDWFLAFTPLVLLFVPLAWLLLTRVIYRFDEPAGGGAGDRVRDVVRAERKALGMMSRPERRMAWVFGATAALWIFRADVRMGDWVIPGWSRLLIGESAQDPVWYAAHKNDISDATVAIFMAILMFVIPSGAVRINGSRDRRGSARFLMDWRTASKLPWEVLLLLGGGFCLAHGFKVSGLDALVGGYLAPWLEDRPAWMVVGAVALLVSFLTEITSNTATTAVLLPVMASAAVAAGVDPMTVMLPATLAASAAFMMPVATPPNAVVFSTRRIPVPVMAKAGFWLNLLMVGLITLVFQFWAADRLGVSEGLPIWATE